jgi:hypothetical protein
VEFDELLRARDDAERRFGHLPGVQGFGVGDAVIRVYVRDAEAAAQIPRSLDGVPVEVVRVGEIVGGG